MATVKRKKFGWFWSIFPNWLRRRAEKYVIQPVILYYRRTHIAKPLPIRPRNDTAPLVVAGLFRSASGIGEGARSTFHALKNAGYDPIAVDLTDKFGLIDTDCDITLSQMPRDHSGTLIVQLNSPETPKALYDLGVKADQRWYVIGFWAWELPVFPKGWEKNFDLISEIWTPSAFTTQALQLKDNAPPVKTIGHAIDTPKLLTKMSVDIGIPENAFVFLTFADSLSSFDRKNPFGVIDAFKVAFNGTENCFLIIKTRNIMRDPAAYKDLTQAISGLANVKHEDVSYTHAERWALLNSCDCVVSLHRAEGFGLTIAEAMSLEKSVITTGWSGNMEFCNEYNTHLVDFELIRATDRYGRYDTYAASWANPSVQNASAAMVLVYNNQKYRTELGKKAHETITNYSRSTVVKRIQEALR